MAQQTGVAHPPDAMVEDAPPANAPETQAKPSAAVPAAAPAQAAPVASQGVARTDEYRPYVPLHEASPVLKTREEAVANNNPDDGIVTELPHRANEVPVNTMLRVRLTQEIATDSTAPDTPFTATLAEDVTSDGRVVIPAGATVEGRVTEIRGGKRVHGPAMIHLDPQDVVLPDGSRMPLRASVLDTDQYQVTRIDAEGNIVRKDHVGSTLTAMGLTTGGAAAAGAILGGGVGALVGAGIGAGVSTAWWLKQDRQTHLPVNTLVVLSLTAPIVLTPEVRVPEFSAAPMAAPAPGRTSAPPVAALPAYNAQSFVPVN